MGGQWVQLYETEQAQDYFQNLQTFLSEERLNHTVTPLEDQVFEAFRRTQDVEIKVVIIGQDPNPDPEKATGMAFCLPPDIERSNVDCAINTIFDALEADNVIFQAPIHGYLGNWAKEGVLLLNSTLTYRKNEEGRNAHFDRGWEQFSGHVVQYLCSNYDNLVFMLWGGKARNLRQFINEENHFVMEGCHPAAWRYPDNSGYYEDFISKLFFSRANTYLENQNILPINWQI